MHERFLRQGGRELPRPHYPPLGFEPAAKLFEIRGLRLQIGGKSVPEQLLRGCLDQLEATVRMLAARGTKEFYRRSLQLFGTPADEDLAIARYWAGRPMPRAATPTLSAEECAKRIRSIVRPVLGDRCDVRLSSKIAAFAAAGASTIAVRADAKFTVRQARALAHHEGLWHVLTALNGSLQPTLTVLGSGLGFFTESQEGGGILSEFLTGNLANDRFIELAERTLAVGRAAAGADYIEVWRALSERFGERRACHLAERVFRGGVLTGGAPFTKDAVYQRGYCRAFEFVRDALDASDEERVVAFFAGKMAIEDVDAVRGLMDEGLVARPKLTPQWWHARDRLNALITHSATLERLPRPGAAPAARRRL